MLLQYNLTFLTQNNAETLKFKYKKKKTISIVVKKKFKLKAALPYKIPNKSPSSTQYFYCANVLAFIVAQESNV